LSRNVDTLRALYLALNRGDFDSLVQYLHPEVEIHPGLGGELDMSTEYRGREGMKEFIETAWRGYDVAVEAQDMISAPGDRILVTERWKLRGRDGIETEAQLTDVYVFRDGLIARVDGFREKADALKAAGLAE
jgi:ketosteroid isomerase-like protein